MSLLSAIALPFLLAVLLGAPGRLRHLALRLAPWAPLVLLWPLMSGETRHVDWPLLGVILGTDAVSAPLVVLTALAWTVAGWFAASTVGESKRWFWSGWLGALGGMNLLLLAADMASFYVGYAILSLSAYLLISHARNQEAWRAARIYLIMALAGEAAILAGVLLLAGELGNIGLSALPEHVDILIDSPARWLLLGGFAVKMGIIPLHLWLPLAHPAAPVPASAILSGVIVKAGLLGWLRFAPGLALDPSLIGIGLLVIGMITAFGGAALGLTQHRIKTVLAYSTISQMGLLLAAFSLLYLAPDQRELIIAMIGLLALHHGLNKAALFLACGCSPGAGRWRLLLFAVPALALTAAPLTTGYLAKSWLKSGISTALPGQVWIVLITLSSTATALIMWRALSLARESTDKAQPIHPAWPVMVLLALSVPWFWASHQGLVYGITASSLWSASWPLLLAAALIAIKTLWLPERHLELPEGDLVQPLERIAESLRQRSSQVLAITMGRRVGLSLEWKEALLTMERRITALPVVGLLILLLGGLLWLSLTI